MLATEGDKHTLDISSASEYGTSEGKTLVKARRLIGTPSTTTPTSRPAADLVAGLRPCGLEVHQPVPVAPTRAFLDR
ncbi:hypothetical protein SSCG_05915 [Streptomyces clavuligerus]|nr:hypothetical protein [Streptomyces clavuligerus]EDY53107.1 hypothetical protein SSCG_05915 [Streptomyces clavuligerus]